MNRKSVDEKKKREMELVLDMQRDKEVYKRVQTEHKQQYLKEFKQNLEFQEMEMKERENKEKQFKQLQVSGMLEQNHMQEKVLTS